MDVKSIVLLGFVNKANEYLKNEFQSNKQVEDLNQLENLKLDELRNEIISETEMAFSNSKVSVDELMKVGSDAFNSFISEKKDSNELIDEFNQLFDDFKDDGVSKVKSDLDELLSFYEPIPSEKFVDDDDEYLKLISEAANKAKGEETNVFSEVKKPKDEEDLDDIFSEILGHEAAPKEKVKVVEEVKPEPKKEEKKISANDEYLKGLISELKSQLAEEKQKVDKAADRVSIFEKISNLYPYLNGGFIRAVYSLKESIAKENPIGKKIVILHRVYFKDVESLRQFVEIVSNHDYTVNVDESKFVVDVFKEHINADGKILTNIFEIANQAKVLDGDYEGYRIVKRED